ncbi:hypothetical protein CBR_g31996 [Chara braunii]|uniref:Reverse transcriptase domain-containing protein n=1 Tax=Chara braunii TaxID=69332 RepID=A0A388LGA4_CHABU|nr:hypothetical protein CBR_g31996 [Chara braunii]|eukprot:GBG81321.1 hypothetical protein CBR_g31996 [Chara braunii]
MDHEQEWQLIKPHSETVVDWVDAGLRVISLKLDSSQITAFQRNKEEAELKARVEEAEKMMGLHPVSDLLWAEERKDRLQEWGGWQIREQERWIKILETKGIIISYRVTKETFRKLLPKNKSVQMKELRHPHQLGRPLATTNEEMCSYAKDYFQDIMMTRRPYDNVDDNMAEGSALWNNLTIRVSEEARIWLDRPVTEEELGATLRCMARGKAPGDDGLPVEFFESCGEALKADLVEMYNAIQAGGRLGKSMTRGIISLLFKKGERNEVRNWRPISLLNVVYKILAKTLANRLANYLPCIVHRDQGAFVLGRSIFENVVIAIEALKLIEKEESNTAVLLLDLEKA